MRKKLDTYTGRVLHGLAVATSSVGASATGVSGGDIFGLFNIFIGVMLVAAILAYVTGLIVWIVRLGTIARVEGIHIMEWGVVILFVLVVLLAIVQYFTSHPQAVTMLIAGIIAIFVGWIVIQVMKGSGGEKKEE
jgi:hypothetical protein